jgi:phospholipid N-methyltransferase
MRESLKAGVQVVSAPQLFPTPKGLAQRMADMLEIKGGDRVLEPSAGTGILLGALGGKTFDAPLCVSSSNIPDNLHAVEINRNLAERLRGEFPFTNVHCGDFLHMNGDLGTFHKIIMNPPFADGADIKHIQHAAGFLKPGGRLVAVCANGPRQRDQLMPLATEWIDLPQGTFKDAGTMVNTALLVIEG